MNNFWSYKSICSIFIFRKTLLTSQTYWQSFLCENLAMTVWFLLLTLRQTSIRSVGVLQPGFSKMATTFSSEASSSTSLGRPTMSSHSRLEYCAFNQHWTSIVTSLLDRRILTCFVTGASACNLEKNLIQLTHLYQRNLIYLLKKRRYIGIRSFFFIFCNDLFV